MLRSVLLSLVVVGALQAQEQGRPRARDLGVPFDGAPGPLNAITDVSGVLVGHTTLIEGHGADAIRTGVTAVLPRAELGLFPAATYVLNGDAELSGAIFAEEFGWLRSPLMLTGTASNGTVYTAVIKWSARRFPDRPVHMPVVADTWDAELSDYLAFPVTEEHVFAALDGARSGPVPEGSVGGGTGMFCHDLKAGIGTSSRVLPAEQGAYTVGVLVQTNYGARDELRIAGVPVGRELTTPLPEFREAPAKQAGDEQAGEEQAGDEQREGRSVIVVVATDAPLSPLTLKALARRATLGLARNGATASPYSGDIVIAFSTMEFEWVEDTPERLRTETVWPYEMGPLFTATIQATEEAVINSLVAAQVMTGLNGSTVHALDHGELQDVLRRYNRLEESAPKLR